MLICRVTVLAFLLSRFLVLGVGVVFSYFPLVSGRVSLVLKMHKQDMRATIVRSVNLWRSMNAWSA